MRLHPVKCTSAAVFGHQPLCIIDLGTRDEYMQQCARRQRQASTLLHVEPAATPNIGDFRRHAGSDQEERMAPFQGTVGVAGQG